MTAQLGEPLAIFDDVAICDRHGHELRIVTDGQRAYVYPIVDTLHVSSEATVCRVGVTLTVSCPVAPGTLNMSGDPEQCDGEASWRIDSDGWTASADARRLLIAYGRNVEQ